MKNNKIFKRFIENFLIVNSLVWLIISVPMFIITLGESRWSFAWLLLSTICSAIGLTMIDVEH